MGYKALKQFDYSPDGVTVKTAKKDSIITDLTDQVVIDALIEGEAIAEATEAESAEEQKRLDKQNARMAGDPKIHTPEKVSATTPREVARADQVAKESAAQKDLEDSMIGRKPQADTAESEEKVEESKDAAAQAAENKSMQRSPEDKGGAKK